MYIELPVKSDVSHVSKHYVNRSLEAELARIDTEVVVIYVVPLSACIVLVISCAGTVNVFNAFTRFLFGYSVHIDYVLNASLLVSVEEQTDNFGVVLLDIVSATSDNNAILLLRKVADYLCLIVKKVVV